MASKPPDRRIAELQGVRALHDRFTDKWANMCRFPASVDAHDVASLLTALTLLEARETALIAALKAVSPEEEVE